MMKTYALDAVALASAVCLGVAVYLWFGGAATFAYAAMVLFVVWWSLSLRQDVDGD